MSNEATGLDKAEVLRIVAEALASSGVSNLLTPAGLGRVLSYAADVATAGRNPVPEGDHADKAVPVAQAGLLNGGQQSDPRPWLPGDVVRLDGGGCWSRDRDGANLWQLVYYPPDRNFYLVELTDRLLDKSHPVLVLRNGFPVGASTDQNTATDEWSDRVALVELIRAARKKHKGPDDSDAESLRQAAERLDRDADYIGGQHTRAQVAAVLYVVADIVNSAASEVAAAVSGSGAEEQNNG